ncbi:MAG: tetratricopeptide repeat protein [Verrucomicrobiota bacterium]
MKLLSFILTAVLLLSGRMLRGEDIIFLKTDQQQKGQIVGADGTNVLLEIAVGSGKGRVPVPISNIQKIEMTVPSEVTSVKKTDPAAVISTLEPVVKKFKGLPADWVVDAMGTLADAYSATGKNTEAAAYYSQIEQLFPGSKYVIKANVGKAKAALSAGNTDEALKLLDPLIEAANKTAAPSAEEGRLYGEAFLVKGMALEKKNDLEGALESYLTTVTSFYHHVDVVNQAEELAKKLRSQNPQLVVR